MWRTQSIQFHRQIELRSGLWKKCFILLAFFATSGCGASLNDPQADHSFLTDEPCKAPCWQGLELDKSSEKEIIETLKELPFIEASTIYTYTTTWIGDEAAIGINYGCSHPPIEDYCGSLRVSRDRLKYVSLTVGYHLTLETVVGKLDPPDYIDYGPLHPEIGGCDLKLYWPEQNIMVEYINEKADSVCNAIRAGKKLSPEIEVTELWYFVKESFGPSPGSCCTRIPWPGFAEP